MAHFCAAATGPPGRLAWGIFAPPLTPQSALFWTRVPTTRALAWLRACSSAMWTCERQGVEARPTSSPFCALAVAVDPDNRAVDHCELHIRFIRHDIKYPFENIRLDPVAKTLGYRIPIPETGRQITPRASSARNPQHGLQK